MKKRKVRFYLDYEKEETWINEMAANGWHLKGYFFFFYTFIKGEPGTFIYRTEFLGGMSSKESKEYLGFMEESGVTIVQNYGAWVYMKKPAAQGPFEIYTDKESKVAYYNRILKIFGLLFIVNLYLGIFNLNLDGDKTNFGVVNSGVGVLSIAVAILIAVPIVKIMQRKRALTKDQDFFE